MFSGALGAIVIHLLALLLMVAWPKLFPRDDSQGQVFMVSIISLEAGAFRDGADLEQGGAADGANERKPDGAQSSGSVVPNAMEAPAATLSDPPDAGTSSLMAAELDEPEEPELPSDPEPSRQEPIASEPPARERLDAAVPPNESEKKPQPEIIPRKSAKAPPQTRKSLRKNAGTALVRDRTTPSSSHTRESALRSAPSSLVQGAEALEGGTGHGGGMSAEPGSGEATAAKDARKGGGLGPGQQEFQVTQVDKPPEIVNRVEPDYPRTARLRRLSGRVVVKLLVDPQGRVRRQSIVEATPGGTFDGCVLEAVAKWRFKPGCYKGQPVSTWVVMPIQFKLSGR
jgi:protein TonB